MSTVAETCPGDDEEFGEKAVPWERSKGTVKAHSMSLDTQLGV